MNGDIPNYFGDQMRAKALGDQNRFRQIAAQAYAASPDQRTGLIQQAVALDPSGGASLDKTLRSQEEEAASKAAGAARYVLNAVETKNPAAVQGAYQTVRPFLARIGQAHGKVPPEQWSDDMLPMLHQVIAASSGGGAAGAVQSTYVDENGQRVAIMRDGSQRALGGNLNNLRPIKTTLPDGREATVTFDPITGRGTITQVGGAGAAPSAGPVQFTSADGTPVQIGADVPPEVAAQIRAAEAGGPVGMPAVGPTPADRAAAEAEAKARVEAQYAPGIAGATEAARVAAGLHYAPQQAAADANAERMKAEAKAAAERDATQAQRAMSSADTLNLLSQAERLIGQSTGSVAGAIYDKAAGAFGESTPGAEAIASLKTIAGQIVSKMPRMEGPQSNYDVQMYKEMAGDLANPYVPREQRLAALRTIRLLNEKYAGAQRRGGDRSRNAAVPQAGEVRRGYRYVGGDPSQRSSWEPVR